MNINDVLIRVLKKNDEISEQILHRNEEEEEVKLTLEIKAREARDREIAERFQNEEWEITKLEQQRQVEINRQTENERLHSDELKRIEKETKDRKSQLERLRVAARELEEANRKAEEEEEEIAQLKRALAAKEANRRGNNTRARSSERKSSRQEVSVSEEEEVEWEGNFFVEEASDEDERPVRRGSEAKRSASGSPRRRLVPVYSTDEDEEDLQSMKSSRLKPSRRKLSSASLPEADFKPSISAKARMARRNVSSASLRVQDTEDDCTDSDEEDNYSPSPPRKNRQAKRKPQTSSGNMDDLMAQFQGFMPGLGSPHKSRSRSGSNSRSGSPIYMGGVHSNSYIPGHGGPFSPPIGPFGYGMPGSVINSSIGNIVNSAISNVGNDNSVRKVYRK